MPTIKDKRKPATIVAGLKKELKRERQLVADYLARNRALSNELGIIKPYAEVLKRSIDRFERVQQLTLQLEDLLNKARAHDAQDERLAAVEKFIAEQALGMRPLVPDSIIENAR